MGRRGPPALPSAMKRSRGTFQPCRNSPAEPRGTEFRRLLLEFGLTPAAATRVRADGEQAAEGDANQRRFFSLVAGKRRKAGTP
ncbi:MAG: hypothetical protein K8T90_08770 [Planctomycetes bacterium]|nr:hypothetical protein [Planctomycetota bacterium]